MDKLGISWLKPITLYFNPRLKPGVNKQDSMALALNNRIILNYTISKLTFLNEYKCNLRCTLLILIE